MDTCSILFKWSSPFVAGEDREEEFGVVFRIHGKCTELGNQLNI